MLPRLPCPSVPALLSSFDCCSACYSDCSSPCISACLPRCSAPAPLPVTCSFEKVLMCSTAALLSSLFFLLLLCLIFWLFPAPLRAPLHVPSFSSSSLLSSRHNSLLPLTPYSPFAPLFSLILCLLHQLLCLLLSSCCSKECDSHLPRRMPPVACCQYQRLPSLPATHSPLAASACDYYLCNTRRVSGNSIQFQSLPGRPSTNWVRQVWKIRAELGMQSDCSKGCRGKGWRRSKRGDHGQAADRPIKLRRS